MTGQKMNVQNIKQALNPRQWWTIAFVLIGLILFILISAPSSPQSTGSTYSRAPEGYGAWYAYMENKGAKLERMRRPVDVNFFKSAKKTTFIQILADDDNRYFGQYEQYSAISQELEKGNQIIIIGTKRTPGGNTRATQANFTSTGISPADGKIIIETSRRYLSNSAPVLAQPIVPILKDDSGALVLENKVGQGSMIYVVPQFLGANAYQDTNNFAYLKSLIKNDRIIIDEYIHGYRDGQTAKEEGKSDVFEFLMQTPLILVMIQTGIGLLVLIYGKNWRLGPVRTLTPPPVNNSKAYIQALAGILQKANSTDFVTETLSKAELTNLQRSLGLSRSAQQDPAELIKLWQETTDQNAKGQPNPNLERIFLSLHRQHKLSEAELTQWLALLPQISTKPRP